MKNVYFGLFKVREDLIQNFRCGKGVVEKVDLLFASYSEGDYDGDAFVLYKQDGKLYEINGSHCSCYGLEDQWHPEETSWAAIHQRFYLNSGLSYQHESDAIQALKELITENHEINNEDNENR